MATQDQEDASGVLGLLAYAIDTYEKRVDYFTTKTEESEMANKITIMPQLMELGSHMDAENRHIFVPVFIDGRKQAKTIAGHINIRTNMFHLDESHNTELIRALEIEGFDEARICKIIEER